MAEHRRRTRQRARDVPRDERGHERRREALGDVEQRDRKAEASAVDAPDVRGSDVPAAELADVGTPGNPDDPEAEREAAGEIAGRDEEQGLYGTRS
jgi:hypothetical protein